MSMYEKMTPHEAMIVATITALHDYNDAGLAVYRDALACARRTLEQEWARAALTGSAGACGGGGEKAIHMTIGSLDGRKGDAYFWRDAAEVAESCLAAAEESKSEAARIAFENGRASAVVLASDGRSGDAATWRDRCLDAEKRAEEAEAGLLPVCEAGGRSGNAIQWMARCRDAERERDALKAELAEAKKRLDEILSPGGKQAWCRVEERDAALARAKTLERDREIVVSALQEATAKIRTSRDAAGAQP